MAHLSIMSCTELKILSVWLPAEGPRTHRHSQRRGDPEGLGLLTALLHQLHNQRGYRVEGQHGSVRVCPASAAELSK